jgi:hypothetical protein
MLTAHPPRIYRRPYTRQYGASVTSITLTALLAPAGTMLCTLQ